MLVASPTLCEQIYKDEKDHVIADSSQPLSTVEGVPDGWKVTGVWPFASGCQNAEWIGGECGMMEGGSPIDASLAMRNSRIADLAASLPALLFALVAAHPEKYTRHPNGRWF